MRTYTDIDDRCWKTPKQNATNAHQLLRGEVDALRSSAHCVRCLPLLCTTHILDQQQRKEAWRLFVHWWSQTLNSLLVKWRQCRGGETLSSLSEFYSAVVRASKGPCLLCVWVFCMQRWEQAKVTFLFWFLTMAVMHLCPPPSSSLTTALWLPLFLQPSLI